MTYTEPLRLEPGDELRCPHCRRWHPVTTWHTEGTPYTQQMLYWKCAKGMYFAGTRGHISRHETIAPSVLEDSAAQTRSITEDREKLQAPLAAWWQTHGSERAH